MTNIFTSISESESQAEQFSKLDKGVVLSTSHTDSTLSDHTVKVATQTSGQIEAEVLVNSGGDFFLPPVGSPVVIGFEKDNTPNIIGCDYVEVDTERLDGGERRIGHPTSNSHVLLDNDGVITVVSDDGTEVQIHDDHMVVNGGSEPVITDIEVETNSDGYVTDVSPVYNESILL